ncbi:Ribosomal protein S18 [Giardia duodenalis]|uniref:Ribosomal protein S18 n=1 Tax=Giardia intestinalis (strain ATCC 50803 / WB clone C6) TaxID=184922 RepID=A8BZ58_GIAIC|nr:Ribosomal protein S18 [Giardia intestinalis]7PWF_S Chain S, Ribosomal protein S18 [Giardia lamblia ATCC 50803]7PWO_S1 Chain S1, Ribosomal protein S18 [Giardia lamblia ATCC 50803]8BR8_SV Chain SV, Ribosomal protein S18 [Giardia lamblia ATCC 50803]8BRM_SV Chain SV, Ribosomal protein S18 [Giardia lamblia ATCC 50803]8BSI_SV Chain SV, Ribosomal protein S18 [Giardia intestinalis]8BSJ_SV Chain SV, Ribosomal protein S18 [Giardia intestinalis]8BTD_SV Chain SV, Ribosomal protein S18 [Giardia lambli|eukprot:XP_001704088.1 Ribosomal protein S18 [Giardia lamblia ATCC 50803]
MTTIVQPNDYRDLLRMFNTNIQGKVVLECALVGIKGIGRRFANVALKKANIDVHKRAGELTAAEEDALMKVLEDPLSHGIPAWMLNRNNDFESGKDMHILVNTIASTHRADLERLRKTRCERGVRHHHNLKVRGQHTKSTGRRGHVVGVQRKKK